MRILRRVAGHLAPAVQLGTARPAVPAGFRAAVATGVPLLLGTASGVRGATFAALAGFLTTLADKGGSYRTRALTQGTLLLAATTATVAGALAGGHARLSIPLTFAVAVLCGFALAYGTAMGSVGISTAVVFVASLASPAPAADALMRGSLVFAGAAWAMVLALGLWPLRPYRPARRTIASCYRAVSDLAHEIARHVGHPEEDAWHEALARRSAAIRSAIESARAILAATRGARVGETRRGERLVVLLAAADQIFGTLLILSEALEQVAGHMDPATVELIRSTIARFGASSRALAVLVEREREDASEREIPDWSPSDLEHALRPDVRKSPDSETIAVLFDRILEFWLTARDAASGIAGRVSPTEPAPAPDETLVSMLRPHLSPTSVVFRHALRMGVSAAVAVAATELLHLKRGYWVTIAAIIIVQPYLGASTLKGLQRIAGTIVGCALTAVLASALHDNSLGVVAVVFVLAGIGVALQPVNYALFTAFITATFVLLAESTTGDWHLVGVRIVNTLIGGAIALLASRVMWPERELVRLPQHLSNALRANAEYLEDVIAAVAADAGDVGGSEARREVGLATLNAEASFQRLLIETPNDAELVEPIMALLVFNRRLSRGLTAMLTTRRSDIKPTAAFASAAVRELRKIASALDEGRTPEPFVLPEPRNADVALESIARRLGLMNEAAARLARHVWKLPLS